MKTCYKCKETKPTIEFHKDKTRPDGLMSKCKECRKTYSLENKARLNSNSKKWREANLDYCRQVSRDYCKTRPDIKAVQCAKRRAKKHQATLQGFEEEIKAIYKECKTLQKSSDRQLVVDHIHPLKHPNVCGLHVPWNLQIITKEENLVKKNKFDGTQDNLSWKLD